MVAVFCIKFDLLVQLSFSIFPCSLKVPKIHDFKKFQSQAQQLQSTFSQFSPAMAEGKKTLSLLILWRK